MTTEQEYRSEARVNWSALNLMRDSPLHYQWGLTHPRADTPAMAVGRATHCAILEPDEYPRRYTVAPQYDRRTNDGKTAWAEFRAAHEGIEILRLEDAERIDAMAAVVRDHDTAGPLLRLPGESEVILRWNDAETGVQCKGRADRIARPTGPTLLVDIKITRSTEEYALQRAIHGYGYHGQLAFYADAIEAITGEAPLVYMVAVESDGPHDVAVLELDDELLAQGRDLYRSHLRRLVECQESDRWPGRHPEPIRASLPRWARE